MQIYATASFGEVDELQMCTSVSVCAALELTAIVILRRIRSLLWYYSLTR